jgi:hypothetical protein
MYPRGQPLVEPVGRGRARLVAHRLPIHVRAILSPFPTLVPRPEPVRSPLRHANGDANAINAAGAFRWPLLCASAEIGKAYLWWLPESSARIS